jgi:hypothetical protein
MRAAPTGTVSVSINGGSYSNVSLSDLTEQAVAVDAISVGGYADMGTLIVTAEL